MKGGYETIDHSGHAVKPETISLMGWQVSVGGAGARYCMGVEGSGAARPSNRTSTLLNSLEGHTNGMP